jgi:pimeloyl-ACP methyl ester carboxylesterase
MVYGLGSFQPLLELLCQDCRIVTIDPRGVGGSDALPGEYLMRDHAADVRAVIEAIGNRPVVAAGISRGGTVAVNFTARYPQLVEKLILIGTSLIPASGLIAPDAPVPSDAEIQQWLHQFITMLRAGDYEQAMQLFWPRIHSEPGCRSLIEGFIRMSRETSQEVLRSFFASFLTDGAADPGLDLRPLLSTIQAPTLLLHGEADRITPLAGGRYLAEHIPGAQFYVFEGRGHLPYYTATAEFARVLQRFMQTGQVR